MASKNSSKRAYKKKLGPIERQILGLIALEDQSYEYVLSNTSTRRLYKFRSDLAAYRQRIRQALDRLIEEQYASRSRETISITNAGNHALHSAALRNKGLLTRKNWDGKWRIATFDIPEEHASLRNRVRGVLKEAGFVKLQHSVWIFPHECEALVQLIKEESKLSNHILYGVLDSIENDAILKKHFRL